MTLTSIDYKILKFTSRFDSVSKTDILKNLPDNQYGTNSKLGNLIAVAAIKYASVKNSEFTGFKITSNGISILKNFESQFSEQKRQNLIEEERIQREKKTLEIAEEANHIAKDSNCIAKSSDKKASISNFIAFFALVIAAIALFKK